MAVKGTGMAISRRNLSVALQFFLAVLCIAVSLLLALSSPDVGKAPNPLITFAVYALPVLACLLTANAAYTLILSLKGLPARNLADTLVQRILIHWQRQDARTMARESAQLEDGNEVE